MTSAKSYVNGVGNVNFGYISGAGLTTVDRIDYGNEMTAAPKGPLNNARQYISAVKIRTLVTLLVVVTPEYHQ